MTNLELAVALIEQGRKVFPAWNALGAPGHKSPMSQLVPKGVLSATLDVEQACEWWGYYPDALVGLACGDGLTVVDLDDRDAERGNGIAAWEAFGGETEGANVVTTQSGGKHLYFEGNAPNSKDTIAGGLEVRCKGYYVIAWALVDTTQLPPLPAFLQTHIAESTRQSTERRSKLSLTTRYDLIGAFEAEDGYIGEVGRQGKHAVVCPWVDQHGDKVYKPDTTVIFEPDAEGKPWAFHCSRTSCNGSSGDKRVIRDVIKLLAPKHPEFFTEDAVPDETADDIAVVRDGHEYALTHGALTINAGRLAWKGEDLNAEIIITDGDFKMAPANIILNKLSSRNDLTRFRPTWESQWNSFCRQVIISERENSEQSIDLSTFVCPVANPEYIAHALLPPLVSDEINIWFGDGGTGKSLLALAAAGYLVKQGKRVLYLDFEMSAGAHRRRLTQLFGDNLPSIEYMTCDRPLPLIGDSIVRKVKRAGIDFVIIDSVVFACGGPAEDSETVGNYCAVARRTGVGTLHLAHITKSADAQATMKPFGSSFWHNSARSTWFIKQDSIRVEKKKETIIDLSLYHRKTNFGPPETQPRGLRIVHTYETNRMDFKSFASEAVDKSTPGLMRQIIGGRGPMDKDTLKAALKEAGVKPNTITQAINRELKAGTIVEHNALIHLKE